jgi:hypothetical protein
MVGGPDVTVIPLGEAYSNENVLGPRAGSGRCFRPPRSQQWCQYIQSKQARGEEVLGRQRLARPLAQSRTGRRKR